MSRRLRRLGILTLILLLVGSIALVLTGRARLDDDRTRVDERWTPLRAPLGERYDQLAAVLAQLQEAGAGDRDVSRELGRELTRWQRLRRSPTDEADAEAEAAASNRLEGLAARAASAVSNSPRLSAVAPLADALTVLGQMLPPPEVVTAYNDAAERYQKTRESIQYTFAARLLGFDARPALVVPSAVGTPS
jgi:hypothetical protein